MAKQAVEEYQQQTLSAAHAHDQRAVSEITPAAGTVKPSSDILSPGPRRLTHETGFQFNSGKRRVESGKELATDCTENTD